MTIEKDGGLREDGAQGLVEPIKRESDQAAPIAESLVCGATDNELAAEPRCAHELGGAELDSVAGGVMVEKNLPKRHSAGIS